MTTCYKIEGWRKERSFSPSVSIRPPRVSLFEERLVEAEQEGTLTGSMADITLEGQTTPLRRRWRSFILDPTRSSIQAPALYVENTREGRYRLSGLPCEDEEGTRFIVHKPDEVILQVDGEIVERNPYKTVTEGFLTPGQNLVAVGPSFDSEDPSKRVQVEVWKE